MNDPYVVLGLKRGAPEADVKSAFRKAAKECHPDLHPNDPKAEKRFKEINEAYETITKPQQQAHPNIHWQTFDFDFNEIFGSRSGFHDIFAEMRARQRNADTHIEIKMTLEEAFVGKEFTVQIPNGHETRSVKVAIPAGIRHGMRISMTKSGSQNNPNMPPGDLYVTVNILPHPRFIREGNNLITIVPVTAFEVLLNKNIEVINIENQSLNVTIPSGFDSSRKLRVAGQGMPDVHTKIRNDLLVELFITYPELSEEQKNQLEVLIKEKKE